MRLFLLSWFCCLLLAPLHAQSWESTVTGTVYGTNSPVFGVQVYLLENADTINRFTTENYGLFELTSIFCVENNYTLVIVKKCFRERYPIYISGKSTPEIQHYFFDTLNILRCCIPGILPPAMVYTENRSHSIIKMDIRLIQELLLEYPSMKMAFVQGTLPGERKRVIRKRMQQFEKEIQKSGLDLNRVSFPTNPGIPDFTVAENDAFGLHPYITAKIVSL